MNISLIDELNTGEDELNSARRMRDYDWIAECYGQIAVTVEKLYKTQNATIALELERVLIAGEQNGIRKTSKTHSAISEHLKRIDKAQKADVAQIKNPRKYHSAAFLDHADKYFRDGTANDCIRVALAECRKRLKYLITAIGAEDNEPKRDCNMLRHWGLFDAERSFIERQIDHQKKYGSAEEKKLARTDSLESFDAKRRREERELRMTESPEEE